LGVWKRPLQKLTKDALVTLIFELLIFFSFAVLDIELRALHLLSRCSTTWAIPVALFGFSYFSDTVSCFWSGASLRLQSSYLWLCLAGIIDMLVLLTFIWAGLEPWPSCLCFYSNS
jgi:hypothetical protein